MTLLEELVQLSRQRQDIDRAIREKVIEAHGEHVPISQIANAAGVTRPTIYAWVSDGAGG